MCFFSKYIEIRISCGDNNKKCGDMWWITNCDDTSKNLVALTTPYVYIYIYI